MARYKMIINTDTYKCGRCSKKNWEPGTRNDYMIAINGITRTLRSMREVMWQLELFRGCSFLSSEWSANNPEENFGLSDRYCKFLKKTQLSIMTAYADFTDNSIYLAMDGCRVTFLLAL